MKRSIDNQNDIEVISIIIASGKIAGNECTIQTINVKFEVFKWAYVIQKQFPICLSYAITVHKSQGLSLQTAVVDAGNSMIECGQIYAAFSIVTSLKLFKTYM